MKQALSILCIIALTLPACKRICYQCNQYCAYCVNPHDSAVAYKVCSTSADGNNQINAFMSAYQDSGYTCNLLNQQNSFCGGTNSNNKAINYYEQENYYCEQVNN